MEPVGPESFSERIRMSDDFRIDMTDGEAPQIDVAILVCPGYNPVDIIGVHTVLGLMPGVNLHLVWKDTDEVIGVPIFPTRPTTTFDDCPADLDVLFAGAPGFDAFEDEETLAFLADRGSRARWVAGSCGGSLLLGAAGLLKGYRATTNFQAVHLLPLVGATHAEGNVVEDRNRITAGPATGGFEIAFRLVQDIYGDDVVRESILHAEYAPEPLFPVGSPELAGPELTARARAHVAPVMNQLEEVVVRATTRTGVPA
jgi:transcriptional regulator GlxA family with amidase domain